MGEVVISSEELEVRTEIELEKDRKRKDKEEEEEEEEEVETRKRRKEGNTRMAIRWEKLLPKMALRVLLVEADDSTRQIIAALLRKCSYKVAAIPDGLKAWEMLKGRPHNVDLILTEVDLPSISGYALLTLIMEHEICRNIPVIMMSSQDSISTVYKCMLRGAADYLVKPIRRNEMRNLWQHVWRRQSRFSQSLAGGNGPQNESVGQDKVEATSENNAASNHPIGDMACTQNNNEFIEKGSDAQSSCTKPDVESEDARMENMQNFLQPEQGKLFQNAIKMQKNEERIDCGQKLVVHESETGGSAVAACADSNRMTVGPESLRINANICNEACGNNHVLVNSPGEAIDFMGTSTGHNYSDNGKSKFNSKFDFSPHLDLCLTRSHPRGFEIQGTEERHTLRHSNASAFTRYTSRSLQHVHSTLESVRKELVGNSEIKLSSNASDYNADTPGPAPSIGRSITSVVNGQTKESEIGGSCPQQRVFPIQIPSNGPSFNYTSYGFIFPPIFCKQSGVSPISSPSTGSHPEPNSKVNQFYQSNLKRNSERLYDRFGQTANDSTNQSLQKQDHKLDSLEDRGHISPTTVQSATSSFCNGAASHLNIANGSTSGSNSNVDQVAIVRAAAEREQEGGVLHNVNSHRSTQREAALTKFRLKRKDRCYEKKVRYESRKKLAEQRPRVKGQFVRQVHQLPSERAH